VSRSLPEKDRLTVKEVAAYLGLSTWAVYDLNKSGKLPAVPHGNRSWRWKRETVLAFDQPNTPATDTAAALSVSDPRALASVFRQFADFLERQADPQRSMTLPRESVQN
jgi:excisionase family DNA binding protein